jgi:outer membrane protein assembly factor BamD (BamD/ComL family)
VQIAISERFIPLKLHLLNDREHTRQFQVFWTPTILFGDRSGKIRYTSVNFLPPEEFLDIMDIGEALVWMRWRGYDEAIQRLSELEERRPDGPLTAEAMYWRGIAEYFRQGRSSTAANTVWSEIGEQFPGSIWAKRIP